MGQTGLDALTELTGELEACPRKLDDAFAREVADVFCRVLLLAHHHGVDLGSTISDKWLVWRAG